MNKHGQRAALILLAVFSLQLNAAEFSKITMPNGIEWTGYYESGADVLATIKPRAILVIPSDAVIERLNDDYKKAEPKAIKERQSALLSLSEYLTNESGKQRLAQTTQNYKDMAEAARTQSETIGKVTNQTGTATKPTELTVEKPDQELETYKRSRQELSEAYVVMKAAETRMQKAETALFRNIYHHLQTADLTPLVVTISTTTKTTPEFEAALELNVWMLRFSEDRKRGDWEDGSGKYGYAYDRYPYRAFKLYSKLKKVPWIGKYMDELPEH